MSYVLTYKTTRQIGPKDFERQRVIKRVQSSMTVEEVFEMAPENASSITIIKIQEAENE